MQRGRDSRVRSTPLEVFLTLISFRPWVGGISGGSQGAYSVALSGGYDDDVDLGYALYVAFTPVH